jgi:membrane protein
VLQSQSIEATIVYWLSQAFDTQTALFITETLHLQTTNGSFLTIIGTIIAFFGAAAMFQELQEDLNTIFEAPKERISAFRFIPKHIFLLLFVFFTGILLLASFLFTIFFQKFSNFVSTLAPGSLLLFSTLNTLFSFFLITFFVMFLYSALPHKQIPLRTTVLGGMLTAFFFTLSKSFFITYSLGTTSGYGAAGSLLLLLLWIFYNTQIFLFGAELTAHIEKHLTRSSRSSL